MHALELQTPRAKVDEQADFHVIGFKVIHGLGKVDIFQLDDGLQFDHD